MSGRVYVKDVLAGLQNHLQHHEDKLDSKLHNHQIILFGDRGDNGICATSKNHERRIMDIEKVRDEIRQVKWAVVIAILVQAGTYLLNIT